MFKNTISQDMQDAIKKIMNASSPVAEALVGNQHKIDKNKNGRIDAHDFKLLKGQKAGGVKEEAELDEANKESKKEFVARQGRLAAASTETAKDPERLKKLSRIPGYSAAMDLAKKVAPVKEEVEELDELSKSTLGSYAKKATRDAVITRKIGSDFEHQGKRAKSSGMKAASDELSQKYKEKSWKRRDGVDKAVDRLTKEEIELDEAKSLHKMSANELDQAHKDNEAEIEAIHKNDPSKRITMNHPLISKRRSINLHKVIRSKQSNPNYIPPPAHGYNEEANHEVAEGWDDMMKDNKKKAADKGTGKFDRKELKPGVTQYTRKSKTFTDGGSDADLRKANRNSNEEVEADETIIIHNAFTVELKETYSFGEYLTSAKNLVSDDDAVAFANAAFQVQDTSIFTEEYATAYIISKIQEHIQAGQVVSEPKYNTKDGEPYHEYTVTDKEGIHRSYIHHGTVK